MKRRAKLQRKNWAKVSLVVILLAAFTPGSVVGSLLDNSGAPESTHIRCQEGLLVNFGLLACDWAHLANDLGVVGGAYYHVPSSPGLVGWYIMCAGASVQYMCAESLADGSFFWMLSAAKYL